MNFDILCEKKRCRFALNIDLKSKMTAEFGVRPTSADSKTVGGNCCKKYWNNHCSSFSATQAWHDGP